MKLGNGVAVRYLVLAFFTTVGLMTTTVSAELVPLPPVAAESTQSIPSAPNFIVIVTDDQKWDSIGRCLPVFDPYDFDAGADACMPSLQSDLMSSGTTFLKGEVTQSLCCPSRVSILTGQYSTTHGVVTNSGGAFKNNSTIATWLDDAGYRTGLFGKYVNGYGGGGSLSDIPPGWDAFEAYHNYSSGDEPYLEYPWISWKEGDVAPVLTTFDDADSTTGDACAAGNFYSTDLICRRTLDFLAADQTTPFFAYVATAAPHRPNTIADRHAGTFDTVVLPTYPDTNVATAPNPPSYLPQRVYSSKSLNSLRENARLALELNLAVDDMIAELHDQLAADGRLDNTVWIFLSDNGLAHGEHSWNAKRCEYYVCHQVPFVVVCPPAVCSGAQSGAVDGDNYALNIDIAPTIADLAGATPTIEVDGESLVPILNDPAAEWRSYWFMHGNTPDYDGVVGNGIDGKSYKYVELADQTEFELFDLDADPWELVNLAGDASLATVQADLAARLAAHLNGDPPANSGPTADFTSNCTYLDCDFSDASIDADGTVVSWSWDFGDGDTSAEQHPMHSFDDAGTYAVELTVTDDDGATDTVVFDTTVLVPGPPGAGFTHTCDYLTCTLTDTSEGQIVSWNWDLGDGATSTDQHPVYTYTAEGTFSVTLTVTDENDVTDAIVIDVTAIEPPPPEAGFTHTCDYLTCTLTDTSEGQIVSWNWDLGDGATSTDQHPVYTYAAEGTFSVTLTVTDEGGATDAIVIDVTVVEPPPVTTMHVSDIDGALVGSGNSWTAYVDVFVQDEAGLPVADAAVSASTDRNEAFSCTTGTAGSCQMVFAMAARTITLTINSVTHPTLVYAASNNIDPDGDSDGTVITLKAVR